MERRDPNKCAPPKEMTAMMLTLSVDIERMGSDWGAVQLQHAMQRCHSCRHLMSCRYWLADARRPAAGYRDFCPNAGLFERYCTPDRRRSSRFID